MRCVNLSRRLLLSALLVAAVSFVGCDQAEQDAGTSGATGPAAQPNAAADSKPT